MTVDLSPNAENYSHVQIMEAMLSCDVRASAPTGDLCLKTSQIKSVYENVEADPIGAAEHVVALVALIGLAVFAGKHVMKEVRHRRAGHKGDCKCGFCTGDLEGGEGDHYHGGAIV